MPRGGKRPGAGRKPEGITKKVSLTLTEDEWKRIELSGEPTVAAFIKSLMSEIDQLKKKQVNLRKLVYKMNREFES
jgi:hypothetical protein